MEGHSAVPKFDPFGEPSTLGPRWTRWLSGFELFADGKGLIIEQLLAGATAESVQRQHVVRQRRRALLLHSAGPDVQDIFLTLTDTGERREYDVAVTALNNYFVPKANAALAYVRRSESTVSTLVTLTLGTNVALLAAEVQTGTTTSMLSGSVSTQ